MSILLSLSSGHIRAYTPTSFIDSCAKLGLPNAVRQQNDASEFCDLLMGSVEGLFKPYPSQLSNLQVSEAALYAVVLLLMTTVVLRQRIVGERQFRASSGCAVVVLTR